MSTSNTKGCDVLILSADFGTGHHQVSVALEKILKQKQPYWEVEICNFFECIYPLFNKSIKFGYSQMIRRFSFSYDWFYSATKEVDPDSKWQQMLNKMGRSKLLKLISELSPRIVICTFPTPAGVVSQLKREGKIHIPLVVVITDVAVHSQWIHPKVDAYIVAADIVYSRLIDRGIPKEKIYVTGIPIRPQFEISAPDPSVWIKYKLDPSLFTLLIMGGGEGLMPGIEKICERIVDLHLPMQVIALTGSNETLANNLEEIAKASPIPIKVLRYIENIAPIMKISNLLLSKAGGITVFEALALKLPILLYKPLPGHEMCNVDFLLENKAALLARNEEQAIELIKDTIGNPSILKDISTAMKPISKPFSARNAVNIILAIVSGNAEYMTMDSPLEKDEDIYA